MQFLAFTGCPDAKSLVAPLVETGVDGALYENLNDPQGVGLVTMSETPDTFMTQVRGMLADEPFASLRLEPDFSMFGRTYALGHEPDLQETLFDRPRRHVLTKDWPWCIWYPLRRSGAFEKLSDDEQKAILREHGMIGYGFGAADYAHDVRLACHGLDRNDNDFVIGLMGKQLYPLSAIVQAMRKTTQTSQYLERLGPFFVGKAVWQSSE